MVKSVARLLAIVLLALLAARVGYDLWDGWRDDLETGRYVSLCGCAFDEAKKRNGQVHFAVMLSLALSALAAAVTLCRWPRTGLLTLAACFGCLALPPWIGVVAPLPALSKPAPPDYATALAWSGSCVVLAGFCAFAFVRTRRQGGR